MSLPKKVLLVFLLSLASVVVAELLLLFLIRYNPSSIAQVLDLDQSVGTSNSQETNSCLNWYARYEHIDSTETVTRGIFDRIDVNSKNSEIKIVFLSNTAEYYVLFEKDVTNVSVFDSEGKPISISQLQRGDNLKVTEHYSKTADNKENFSVIISKEKP